MALKAALLPAAVAALAGAVATLGWAPFGWWPLAVAAHVLLFGMLQRAASAWHAALLGGIFGVALHLCGHGWIAAALHRHAGLGATSAALSTALVVIYLALFIAVPCGLARALCGRAAMSQACRDTEGSTQSSARDAAASGLPSASARSGVAPTTSALASILAYASLLTLGEWARSFGFNGYTSLSLGYSLVDSVFAGYLLLGGLYLSSWVGLLVSAALAVAWNSRGQRGTASAPGARPRLPMLPLLLPLLLAAGGWGLQRIAWTVPDGPPLSYRLIQSNLAQAGKFDPALVRRHVAHLVERIEAAPADLIVTAETAFPMMLNDLPAATVPRLQQYSRRSGSHIFVGVATVVASADGHNSIVQFAPQMTLARYDKARLMPFGEYSPAGFGWFTGALAIPLKDLSAGADSQAPFVVNAHGHLQRIGALICHEDLIGRDARRRAASSGLLINPSNLAWFDGSLASAQRLQIVRVRALEVGRPLLRIANTGITAQLEHDGRIAARLPAGRDAVLSGIVQPRRGATPYVHAGDSLPLAVCLIGLLPGARAIALRQLRRRPRQPSGETPINQT